MIADRSSKRDPTFDEVDKVVTWHLAEAPLKKTEADVFAIFDCCYAGDSRNGHFSERSFEFLAATSTGHVTRTPGPHSFTSGLIWALVQLSEERGKFTTSELANKVRDSPGFPKDQVPVLYEKGRASSKRIVLAPLSEVGTTTEEPLEQSCASLSSKSVLLDLKFVFGTHPEEADIANLAKAISKISQSQTIVRQVSWGGIHMESDSRPPVSASTPLYRHLWLAPSIFPLQHIQSDTWLSFGCILLIRGNTLGRFELSDRTGHYRQVARHDSSTKFRSLSSTPNLHTDISRPFHSAMPPSIRISDEPTQSGLNSRDVNRHSTFKASVLDVIYHGKIFVIRFFLQPFLGRLHNGELVSVIAPNGLRLLHCISNFFLAGL